MDVYTSIDDTGFDSKPRSGRTPPRRRPKVTSRSENRPGQGAQVRAPGAFEATVSTYDAITDFLDDKMIDAQDLLIENT